MKEESRVKVRLVFEAPDDPEGYQTEQIWTRNVDNVYEVDNIPFFANNLAVGDLIDVEWDEDDGAYYFDSLSEASGHSTVRIVPKERSSINEIGKNLSTMGCSWESLENRNLIAVDVPSETEYNRVLKYIKGSDLIADYDEGCLGFKNK